MLSIKNKTKFKFLAILLVVLISGCSATSKPVVINEVQVEDQSGSDVLNNVSQSGLTNGIALEEPEKQVVKVQTKLEYFSSKKFHEWNPKQEPQPEIKEGVVEAPPAETVVVEEQPDAPVEAPAPQPIDLGRVVFVGDSRTIDMFYDSDQLMYAEVHDGITVFGGHGKGFSFLESSLNEYGLENFDTLVSWMGANDRGNFERYREYYNNLLAMGKRIIVCTVGPSKDQNLQWFDNPNYLNDRMTTYNNALVPWAIEHGVKVIDLYSFVSENITIDWTDGIHYSPRPTTAIWQFILMSLNQ